MASAVEPFSIQKLTVALKQEARQPNSLLAAELNRRKEPLEAYPLDSMSMVGSMNKKGAPYALLKVDSLLYQVKVGDYVAVDYLMTILRPNFLHEGLLPAPLSAVQVGKFATDPHFALVYQDATFSIYRMMLIHSCP